MYRKIIAMGLTACLLLVAAAVAAQQAGHKNVFTFRAGFPAWQNKPYPISVR
mgnify:CR=1 FL=1